MITTPEDMFKVFLDGIKKERISTVEPDYFVRLINTEALPLFYRQKSVAIEYDQKKMDDLQILRVVTDGVYEYSGSVLSPISALETNIGGNVLLHNLFPLPIGDSNGSDVVIGGITYPEYMRLLNVSFKLRYYGDPCETDGTLSGWKKAKFMRSNERSVIMRNPHRRPNGKSRLYYEIIGNKLRLETGDETDTIGVSMRVEYLKYPRLMVYNPLDPSVADVMLEFQSNQCLEIIEIATRIYIERVSDPRYQTKLYEEQQRNIGK